MLLGNEREISNGISSAKTCNIQNGFSKIEQKNGLNGKNGVTQNGIIKNGLLLSNGIKHRQKPNKSNENGKTEQLDLSLFKTPKATTSSSINEITGDEISCRQRSNETEEQRIKVISLN